MFQCWQLRRAAGRGGAVRLGGVEPILCPQLLVLRCSVVVLLWVMRLLVILILLLMLLLSLLML